MSVAGRADRHGHVGEEIKRLIKKLEFDKEILAEQEEEAELKKLSGKDAT